MSRIASGDDPAPCSADGTAGVDKTTHELGGRKVIGNAQAPHDPTVAANAADADRAPRGAASTRSPSGQSRPATDMEGASSGGRA
jgi:hypothetical protein